MTSLIILCAFGGVLLFAVCGGLGMHIAGEKGRSLRVGFFMGLLPLIGHLLLALVPATDLHIVEEMYSRDLITAEDFSKTREIALHRNEA